MQRLRRCMRRVAPRAADSLAGDFAGLAPIIGGGEAYILILLEHKSTPDERVALQVLRYSVLKWDRMALPLPLIIPVVVYHGAKPWSIGKKLSDLFGQFSGSRIWRRYLADFEYHLCDLSKFRDEELEGGEAEVVPKPESAKRRPKR